MVVEDNSGHRRAFSTGFQNPQGDAA